jgi:hypothetical protein
LILVSPVIIELYYKLTDSGAYHKLAICNCILVMLLLVKIVDCGVSETLVKLADTCAVVRQIMVEAN